MKLTVKLTANFERNLESIEKFLQEADAPQAFDAILDELLDKVIPNLERFPGIGPSLLDIQPGSVETLNALEALRSKAGDTQIRQYVLSHYLVLYAATANAVHLLSIKHHRQLSYDLDAIWLSDAKVRSERQQGE